MPASVPPDRRRRGKEESGIAARHVQHHGVIVPEHALRRHVPRGKLHRVPQPASRSETRGLFPAFFMECHSDPANVIDEHRIVHGMEQDYLLYDWGSRFGERVITER